MRITEDFPPQLQPFQTIRLSLVVFTDLTVPVAGNPITVNRIYGSLDSGFHDFGTSWSLAIANVRGQAFEHIISVGRNFASGERLSALSACMAIGKPQ